MSKRLTVVLDRETMEAFEKLLSEANEGFDAGRITASDLICEIILGTKIDIRTLQIKHSDLRRSLKALANRKDIDLEMAIKMLTDLKGKAPKKRPAAVGLEHEC